ncbi:hypothetical protein SUGI_0079990 [Cryptomeria japonica]|nr:hypothetical protein SUGI_0079990 [Cryptomeria japonica]
MFENCKLLVIDKKTINVRGMGIILEDALNATKESVEEGIVVGGGCVFLMLSSKVDEIRETHENDEQKIGVGIGKQSLSYPMRLIAENDRVNESVVVAKVPSNDNSKCQYNAEDLRAAGVIDSIKVVIWMYWQRCTSRQHLKRQVADCSDQLSTYTMSGIALVATSLGEASTNGNWMRNVFQSCGWTMVSFNKTFWKKMILRFA